MSALWLRPVALAVLALYAAGGGLLVSAALAGETPKPDPAAEDRRRATGLAEQIEKLRPLHRKLGKPRPGDWRAGPGRNERGQTFQQYLRCRPVRPIRKRRVLYIQPLGGFTKTQRKIVELTADFMGRYFNLPVKVRKDLPMSLIPKRARRTHPSWGVNQILSTYVLDEVLVPRLPPDAAACIAFTATDLWPGPGWNFVFGQASLRQRVGVWSIFRNGDPEAGPAAFRLCLLRTLKTATHETGHMFSMQHCTAYECNMCGSNHRAESDRRPLALCPECAAKVCWATRSEPIPRYRKLLAFAREQGLKEAAGTYEKSIKALGGKVSPPGPTTRRSRPRSDP